MKDDKKITLTIIVVDTAVQLETNVNAPLKSIAEKAINQTHQAEKHLDRWEMTNQAGTVLTFDAKVVDSGLSDGDTIVMNLRTGVTG